MEQAVFHVDTDSQKLKVEQKYFVKKNIMGF